MYGLLMILSFEELDCSHVWVEATQRSDDLELQDAINMQRWGMRWGSTCMLTMSEKSTSA